MTRNTGFKSSIMFISENVILMDCRISKIKNHGGYFNVVLQDNGDPTNTAVVKIATMRKVAEISEICRDINDSAATITEEELTKRLK